MTPETDIKVLDHHQRIALLCSGGKDSLAALYLARPWWDRTLVIWINGLDNFAETDLQMARIRTLVPHFQEVRSDVRANIAERGWPVGALPVANTWFGRMVSKHPGPLMQHWSDCCSVNKWQPALKAIMESGATCVVRGDRYDEKRLAPLANGAKLGGIEMVFPVWDWGAAEVLDYLREQDPASIPEHYAKGCVSSLDCASCTGFLNENGPGFWRYVRENYPETGAMLLERLSVIHGALATEMDATSRCLNDLTEAFEKEAR